MALERRNQIFLLAAVLVALVIVSYRAVHQSDPAAPSSNGTGAGPAAVARNETPAVKAPDVHLPELEAERPKPGNNGRNLFRFKPKPPPPPPAMPKPGPAAQATAGPPAPVTPPIPLKFMGVIGETNGHKIAVLTDGAGHVFHGTEGSTIEGRYKILHIGAESIEMAYLDGSGRRTIRMTGTGT